MNLTTPNTTYCQNANVVDGGTAFRIQADDITFDGQGFSITAPTAVIAENVTRAIIQNANAVTGQLTLSQSSHSRILSSTAEGIAISSASFNLVRNNVVGDLGISLGDVLGPRSTFNVVQDNTFTGTDLDGVNYISLSGGDDNTIKDNTITLTEVTGQALQIFGASSRNVILRNTINQSHTTDAFFSISIRSLSDSNVLEDNTIISSSQVVEIGAGTGGASNNTTLRGNRIIATTLITFGLRIQNGSSGNVLDRNYVTNDATAVKIPATAGANQTITNNTFVSTQGNALDIETTSTVTNNILYSGSDRALEVTGNANVVRDYNNLFRLDGGDIARIDGVLYANLAAYQAGTGMGLNSISANPLFTDLANDDVSLMVGSPAIDVGDPALGTAFPGARVDMGALESGAVAPAPVTGLVGF